MSTASDVASLSLGQAAVRPSRATSVPGARSRLDRDEDRADRHLVCGADRRRRRAAGSGRADGLRPHLPYLPWRCDALDPRAARDHASRRVALREERSVAPLPGARVVCPDGERLDTPLRRQADAMVCLVNYARFQRGLPPVTAVGLLSRAALAKARRSSAAPISTTTPVAKMQPSTPARRIHGRLGREPLYRRGPSRLATRRPRRLAQLARAPREPVHARPGGRRGSRSRRSPASAATAT